VAHVRVEHIEPGVGPDPPDIGIFLRNQLPNTQRILSRIQSQQHVNVFVEARAGAPGVPLVGWRDVGLWNATSDGAIGIVQRLTWRARRPVVYAECPRRR